MSAERFLAWGAGKPLDFVMFARQPACFASISFEYLQGIAAGEYQGKLPPPPPVKEWLKLYRDHRRRDGSLIDAIEPCEPDE